MVVGLYVLIAALMYATQRSHQYFPGRQGLAASAVGLAGVEDVKVTSPDGETLQAWYSPARSGKPTILYLHGNGGEISDRAERFAAYQAAGFGVFFLSYRGYGGSTGTPSEQGLVNDALAAHDWLIARGIEAEEVVLVGELLGSGVAVQLAAQRPVAGTGARGALCLCRQYRRRDLLVAAGSPSDEGQVRFRLFHCQDRGADPCHPWRF